MTLSTRLLGVLVTALLLGAFGCSRVQTVKVTAVVTLDGQPLEGATVRLVPEERSTGEPANGLTGSDGSCRLYTYAPGDGVVPGAYKISVSKTEQLASERPDTKNPEAMKKMMMASMSKRKSAQAKKPLLPASYADPAKSGLRCEIPPPAGKLVLELRKGGGS